MAFASEAPIPVGDFIQLEFQVRENLSTSDVIQTVSYTHLDVYKRQSDDGAGIPDEAKSKLFDMFYTVDKNRGDGRRGLGLGLSLCKSIIHAHGGIIGVKDHAPHGLTFYFTLYSEEVNCDV